MTHSQHPDAPSSVADTPSFSPECGCHHHGDVDVENSGGRLLATLLINLLIPAVQIGGGLYAGSVALISDAAHNLSDFTSLLIAYVAYRIGRRGASLANTFGYRRAEVLAALINVGLLCGAAVYILMEAADRFRHPQPVQGHLVMWIAAAGILGNGFSAWLLHRDAAHSLNMRGAFLHMVGDFLTSVAVFANGLILIFKPWYWLDPVLSILIVLFILKNCVGIVREASAILMNATPSHINLRELRDFLEKSPEVSGAHFLHAWQVSSASTAFSAHIVVRDQMLSRVEDLGRRLRDTLLHRFGIDHAVLQFETTPCGGGGLLCEMSCGGAPSTNVITEEKTDMKKWAVLLIRIGLGCVFIYASIDKILHPMGFAEAIYNYQILPDALVNLAAVILPWLELITGAALAAGVWTQAALVWVNAMLIVFIAALGFNLARGLNVQCGCFHAAAGDASQAEMIWTIVRDVLMLAAGVFLMTVKRRKDRLIA